MPISNRLYPGELFYDCVKRLFVEMIGVRVCDDQVSNLVKLLSDLRKGDTTINHDVPDDRAITRTAATDDFVLEFPGLGVTHDSPAQ